MVVRDDEAIFGYETPCATPPGGAYTDDGIAKGCIATLNRSTVDLRGWDPEAHLL